MSLARNITLLLISFFCTVNSYSATIGKIKFEGLTKTKEVYLRSIIKCHEGEEFDSTVVFADEQTLNSLNLFFNVKSRFLKIEDSEVYNVTFTVIEATYLYPILSVSGFKTQFKLQVGFNQINFRGRAESIGFLYQYYDRHSFSGFYNANRHGNGKTGHELSISKYSTIEPLYFSDTVADFNFDNYNISAGAHYWLSNRIRFGLGGMYMYEKYAQLDTGALDLGKKEFALHKYQIRSVIEFDNVKQNYDRLHGIKNRFFIETIQTKDFPMASFFKVTNDFSWFHYIGKNGNIGIHQRLGIATNNFSPFSPFVLDGFINVRGIGNRVARGTAEFISNIEYRHTLWRHRLVILQAAVFTDLGTLRKPAGTLTEMFTYRSLNLFTGGGIRINSQFFYKATFRLDYSFNPLDPSQHGITFGVGQFF